MINDSIVFRPEDFDSVLTIDDLTAYVQEIILSFRQNEGNSTQEILNDINNIAIIANKGLSKGSSVQELLDAYEVIKSFSMKLRDKLSKKFALETYDSIAYAFYLDGKRYSADTIEAKWLIKKSDGELRLDLEKAVQDLDENFKGKGKQKIQEIFNRHYNIYLQAISGMYEKHSGYPIGAQVKGAKLNKGHVAEAYENHIAEHHSYAYNFLNNFNNTTITVMDKMILSLDKETQDNYWAAHESPNEAWRHIRSALGTQRGTVAGDVGRFQVKQASTSDNIYSTQVRLASLSTLKNGIKLYNDIFNPDIDISILARKIARYLSEPVKRDEKNLLAYAANKELSKTLEELQKEIKGLIHI